MRMIVPVLLALCAIGPRASATTPPQSPNYCGPTICLEVLPTFGEFSVATSAMAFAEGEQVEIVLSSQHGLAAITSKEVPKDRCDVTTSMTVEGTSQTLFGQAWVGSPNEQICLHITLRYLNKADDQATLGAGPIAALWAVDRTPSIFWGKGYALRLGAQVDIRYEPELERTKETKRTKTQRKGDGGN
jgi:hypothetical protein